MIDRLVGQGYLAGWSLVQHAPEKVSAGAFRAAADRAFARRGPRTVQLARNLLRVLGEDATPAALSAVTHAGLRSYARYWFETFRLPAMDHEAVGEALVAGTTGMEHVRAAQEQGRGVIMTLPHSGNWDMAGLMVCQEFGSFVTVAERLKPESLFRRFAEFRESLGFEVLPLHGGERPAFQVLRERMEQGRITCLVGDRDLDGTGVEVDFFGERTTMPGGPSMLAARTGALLLPAHLAYTDRGWHTEIGAPLELPGTRLRDQVRGGTQQIADFFARGIGEHPADWHMLQPFWPSDRAAAARRASEAQR